MVTLSTAPAEIISEILLWVLPLDLENLALCCKAVYRQIDRKKGDNGLSLLQEHHILIQKYSALTNLKDVGPFFRAMIADQRIAKYVRKLDFRSSQRTADIEDWGIEDLFEDRKLYDLLICAAETIGMGDLLAKHCSKNGENTDFQPLMKRTIRETCRTTNLAIALLLPLLPNLRALSFHWQSSYWDPCIWTLHWTRNVSKRVPILTKLKEMNVYSSGWDCTLPDIVCLTALPLHTFAVEYPESPNFSGSERQSYLRSTIRNLKLWDSKIGMPMLHDYLESFDSLESFILRGPTGGNMPLFTILLSHSKTTLTKLVLRSYSAFLPPYSRIPTGRPRFKQLESLKELHVDWQMLLPKVYVAGQDWEDLLPQSLETLTIHDDHDTDWEEWNVRIIAERYEPLVRDLISCKTGALPRFHDFRCTAWSGFQEKYRGPSSLWPEILEVESGFRDRLGSAGVRFSFQGKSSLE